MKLIPKPKEDAYVPNSRANDRDVEEIIEEFASVRQAAITFFKSLDDEALNRHGIRSGNVMSVRAAAYHIAGHELHHIHSIQENYLANLDKGTNHGITNQTC